MSGDAAPWAALFFSISSRIVGLGLLEAGASASDVRSQPIGYRSLAGLVACAVTAVLYMLALRQLPISGALPLMTCVAAALVGYLAISEPLSGAKRRRSTSGY